MKRFVWFLLLGTLFLSSCQEEVCSFQGQSEEQGIYSSEKEILWMTKTVEESPVTKAVGVKGKYWSSGDTIRIKFLNGTTELQQKVQQYAAEWLEYANLYFKYVGIEEDADVKIGFDLDEVYLAWSTIGTDCRAIPQDQPSLNFVYLDYEDETGIKAEVLRGFGHVLGLGFEHKNPNSTIKFKGTDQQFLDEFNLSGQRLAEFKTLYTTSQTNYTEYDKNSIMTVAIPRSLVTLPPLATTRNTQLSEMDKAFISDWYAEPVITMIIAAGKWAEIIVSVTNWTSSTGGDSLRRVDWGDGCMEYLPKDDRAYSHSFHTGGDHTLRFYGKESSYKMFYSKNGAKAIDISKCISLETFYCNNSTLKELDVSQNLNLGVLSCTGSQLEAINLGNNTKLKMLDISGNRLKNLDISHCPALTNVWCDKNSIDTLNVCQNSQLFQLECQQNGMSRLILGGNGRLNNLNCNDNALSSLDISQCPVIVDLKCANNVLTNLLMNQNTSLRNLDCDGNSLSMLDFEQCPLLIRLWCRDNAFSRLAVEKTRHLCELYYSGNNGESTMTEWIGNLPDRRTLTNGWLEVSDVSKKNSVQPICINLNWSVAVRQAGTAYSLSAATSKRIADPWDFITSDPVWTK